MWVIVDENGLYWSNEHGWTDLAFCTRFTDNEHDFFNHLPRGGTWERAPERPGRNYFLNVSKDDLARQCVTISGLMRHLTDAQYEATVGALRLLETIRDDPG
jgi:hypothetical protein